MRRVERAERMRTFRDLVAESSLGCPRTPISCGHTLVDHASKGWDDDGYPVDPACAVPGCDCDGIA